VVEVFMETGSGVKPDHTERKKIMALALAHEIDTLRDQECRRVSVIAMSGMTFDLTSRPHVGPHARRHCRI
jgi:putative DNA-invertase from lambdoid prophage Rac